MEMLQHNEQFINEAYGTSQSGGGGGRVGGIGRAGRSGRGGAGRTKGKLGPPADKLWIEKWRKDLKIAGVRFFLLQFVNTMNNLGSTAPISAINRNAYLIAS
jgi:histone acetyltransferase 1